MQGEKLACGNAHADNVVLPFGWFYVGTQLLPLDIIKIESPSELCNRGSSSN
jgi:homoserine kinase